MDFSNQIILLGAALLLVSIFASVLSARMGAPLLLVFMILGMLAGEEGPGGIPFDNIQVAHLIGSLALAIILFDGGLRTRAATFRVALWPAVSLATVGVLVTAGLTGLFAAWILDLHWLQGLLIGAIVGSTDAAAVFSLLHARGLELKKRVSATLEIESGSNDPMAIFLTIVLVDLLVAGESLTWAVIGQFVQQFGIGALAGVAAGRLLAWLINRLSLQSSALYALLAFGGGVFAFAATSLIGGSGFLAVYLAGLVLGNRRIQAAQNILRFHDGLAWLMQITMFLMLGLLVFPSALLPLAPQAMLIALVLMLLARPLAVFISLLPFHSPWREQVFISWVGLRGAVPVVLALFPLLAGLEQAGTYFNVTFFVVLVSLLLQGWTIAPAARALKLEVPPDPEPIQRVEIGIPGQLDYELLGYPLMPGSLALSLPINHLPLPEHAQISAIIRDSKALNLSKVRKLHAGDYIYVLASPDCLNLLNRLFAMPHAPTHLQEHQFFGDFVLNGEASLADLGALYGFALPADAGAETVSDYLTRAAHNRPVIGDRARLNGVELVVREMEEEKITKVGLKFTPDNL